MDWEKSKMEFRKLNEEKDKCMDNSCLNSVLDGWSKELNSILKAIENDESVHPSTKRVLSKSQETWNQFIEMEEFLAVAPIKDRQPDPYSHLIRSVQDRAIELTQLFSDEKPELPAKVTKCVDNAPTRIAADECYFEAGRDVLDDIWKLEMELLPRMTTPEGQISLLAAERTWRKHTSVHAWLVQHVADDGRMPAKHNAAVLRLYQNRLNQLKSLANSSD